MSFQRETERLILRDIRKDDVPILLGYWAEPEARANILSFQREEAHHRKVFENALEWTKYARRPFYQLSVVRKSDGVLIGNCSMTNVKTGSFDSFIGWHYGHAFGGNGYATEAARELLGIGFKLHVAGEIFGDCFVGNRASIRIFEKIGMIPQLNNELFNALRGWTYGEHNPTIRYVISRRQWLAKQAETFNQSS